MQATELLYLTDMSRFDCEATVVGIEEQEGRQIVYLDQTVFYPQGGGQPYDIGVIEHDGINFIVEEVRFVDGLVLHIGFFEKGSLQKDDKVTCKVDAARRAKHARLHSGGHIVDMAVDALGLGWVPGKGYHFPEGSYVEYEGNLEGLDKESVKEKIEHKANELIVSGITTAIRFMPKEEMASVCRHVPDYLPEGKPSRVVMYGDFGVPCGGTHVSALAEVGQLGIRKIKNRRGVIRIGYKVLDK